MTWNPDGRWKGGPEGVWEVARRLLSLHVVFNLHDRGGGEFVFHLRCLLDIRGVERQPVGREGVVECLAETRLQFPCWLLCGVRFESLFHVFREVLYKCVVCGGHPVVYFLKTLLGCRRCCVGGRECVVAKEFEGFPSVVYGFFVGDRALRPRDPEGGWWVVRVCVEVELLKGVDVMVGIGEWVGW